MMIGLLKFLKYLYDNLNKLREREAKYGGEPPVVLINEIQAYEEAVALTEEFIRNLKPLFIDKELKSLLIDGSDDSPDYVPILKDQYTPREIVLNWAENGRKQSLYGINLRGESLPAIDLEEAILGKADLSKTDLRETNFINADLRVANLSQANLSGANLSGARLSRANLSKANLNKAKLVQADLRDADLRGAVLIANFEKANLCGANLSESYLRGMDLIGSELDWDDLDRAFLGDTNFAGAIYDSQTEWPEGIDPPRNAKKV